MGWKNIPEIRDLEPYCKKYGYAYIVTFAVHGNHENYTVTTYGKTKLLCKAASVAGNELKELVQAGTWPNWSEEEPPEPAPDPRIAAIKAERAALKESLAEMVSWYGDMPDDAGLSDECRAATDRAKALVLLR